MSHLNILWTTDNKDTIQNMLSMYAVNSFKNKWWDEINIIIWGASAKIIGEDEEIQKQVVRMIESGVTFEACKSCSDMYKASDKLTELGVDVKYMGIPMTNYLKSSDRFITV